MRSMEFSGRSVDEAIFIGLNEMGVTIDEVEIETLQTESKGIFGIGSKNAVVRLTERDVPLVMEMEQVFQKQAAASQNCRDDRPRQARGGHGERSDRRDHRDRGERMDRMDRGDRGQRRMDDMPPEPQYDYSAELASETPCAQFLSGLLQKMGVSAAVLAANTDNGLRVRIDADSMGLLIGRRGETLDALQYLTSLVANKGRREEGYQRITLDTEGYRSRREETLKRLARKTATQVRNTGRSVAMEPMNPYERRVLHSALQEFAGITTFSEGEEPNRHVIIAPAERSR